MEEPFPPATEADDGEREPRSGLCGDFPAEEVKASPFAGKIEKHSVLFWRAKLSPLGLWRSGMRNTLLQLQHSLLEEVQSCFLSELVF